MTRINNGFFIVNASLPFVELSPRRKDFIRLHSYILFLFFVR